MRVAAMPGIIAIWTSVLLHSLCSCAALRSKADVDGDASWEFRDAVQAATDIFADHGDKMLLAGHIASVVVPHPALLTLSLMKSAYNAYLYAPTQDLHKDVFDRLSATPRSCTSSADCKQPREECGSQGVCQARFGTNASAEEELLRQYDLFQKLREMCVPPHEIDGLMTAARKGFQGVHAPEMLAAAESQRCAAKRWRAEMAFAKLYKWIGKYQEAIDGKHNFVTKRFWSIVWHYLEYSPDKLNHPECTEDMDCGKYQLCTEEGTCRATEDHSLAPASADALCEHGTLDGGCCWSTCSALPVHGCGIAGVTAAPGAATSTRGCNAWIPNNHRVECCKGGAVPTSSGGASHWCCAENDCLKTSEVDGEEEAEDIETYEKQLVKAMREDLQAQMSDGDFEVLATQPDLEEASAWDMLARRVWTIDVQLRRLDKSCPTSIPALFSNATAALGTTGAGAASMLTRQALEAGRCVEGGFFVKEMMSRWASAKIARHVLLAQGKWAIFACPSITTAVRSMIEADSAMSSFQVAHLMGRWQAECAPWVGISLNASSEALIWVPPPGREEGSNSDQVSVKPSGCISACNNVLSGVTRAQVEVLSKVTEYAPSLVMSYVFDKGSFDVVAKSVPTADAVAQAAWLESATWLAYRGREIVQKSKLLNDADIKSFCIAAATRLEGLDKGGVAV
mmetsp:Transcript_106879/g.297621  ORF Transcript_106879/g.297621 Transcript_106879/m.297621 type:complete len:682 (-) Transcript_106879:25-2070(-)